MWHPINTCVSLFLSAAMGEDVEVLCYAFGSPIVSTTAVTTYNPASSSSTAANNGTTLATNGKEIGLRYL